MLYYHYRQHRLSRDSDISLLSYLAVNNKIRAASFGAISMLEKGVADSTDPFAAERAVRLARAGILDYLQAWCVAHGNVEVVPVDLIDLGAGSGWVSARLCRLIGSALSDIGRSPRFRIRFVDLLMSEPTRFFTSEGIEKYIDSIEVASVDYRQWLAHGLVFPNSAKPKPKMMYAWTPTIPDRCRLVERGACSHDAADRTLRYPDRWCPLVL